MLARRYGPTLPLPLESACPHKADAPIAQTLGGGEIVPNSAFDPNYLLTFVFSGVNLTICPQLPQVCTSHSSSVV